MIKRWLPWIIAILCLVVLSSAVLALEPFKVEQYVSDRAGLLAEPEVTQLAQVLDQYARDTGNQLLVITVPSLAERELVEFTEALFKLNQPGQKGKDNGLILFVAKAERKIRIEVGYGLEEAVPDGKAGTIIRETIAPRFKAGDFSGGVVAGVQDLIQAITPDYQVNNRLSKPAPTRSRSNRGFSPLALIVVILITIFTNVFRQNHRQVNRRYHRGYSEPNLWGGGFYGGSGSSGSSRGNDNDFSGGGGSFGGGGSSGEW